MSRIPEGECDDEESQRRWALQRANLVRQIRSKRGQAFLRELLDALEALPEKRLIDSAIARDGCMCAFGALALKRRTDAGESREAVLADLLAKHVHGDGKELDDPSDEAWEAWLEHDEGMIWEWAERELAVPSLLAWEIPCLNDEDEGSYTPEERYDHVIRWVRQQLEREDGPDPCAEQPAVSG